MKRKAKNVAQIAQLDAWRFTGRFVDAAYLAVDAMKGKKASPAIDAVDEIKSRFALALFGSFGTPVSDYDTARMQHRFFNVAKDAGIADLFGKVRALPEYNVAVKQWQDSYGINLRLPPEVTIDFLTLVVRRDIRAIIEGLQLPISALKALAKKWPNPDVVWAPIAIAAARGDLKLARSFLEKWRRSRKNTIPLSILQYRYWFPLMLWLMDDRNGCAALNHVSGERFSMEAYRESRRRLKLPVQTNAFSAVDTLPDCKLVPKPDVWLRQKLRQQL